MEIQCQWTEQENSSPPPPPTQCCGVSGTKCVRIQVEQEGSSVAQEAVGCEVWTRCYSSGHGEVSIYATNQGGCHLLRLMTPNLKAQCSSSATSALHHCMLVCLRTHMHAVKHAEIKGSGQKIRGSCTIKNNLSGSSFTDWQAAVCVPLPLCLSCACSTLPSSILCLFPDVFFFWKRAYCPLEGCNFGQRKAVALQESSEKANSLPLHSRKKNWCVLQLHWG